MTPRRLTNVTYPNGLITSYTYDGNGYLATVIDRSASASFRTNSYTWTNGLAYSHTDERGLAVTNIYDLFERLVKTVYPDGTYITNVYTNFDLVRVLDRMGFTDGFAYNGFGQPLRHTDANQKVTTYAYCDCGSLESINDPLGNVTSYTWDNAGRRTRTTWPGSSGYTDFVYDTPGYLIRVTESSGVSVTNYYTVHGLPYTASNALGRVFRRLYDDGNRISISIDHNGTTNSYGYDALGRLLRSTNSIAKVSEKGVGPGSVPSMLGSALLASSSGK